MTLWIGGSPESRKRIVKWLKEICWRVILNDDGTISQVAGPPEEGVYESGFDCLQQLISSSRTVSIFPIKSNDMRSPGGIILRHCGGACTSQPSSGGILQPNGKPGIGPDGKPGNDTSVYIDESNNGKKGYIEYDRQGNPYTTPMWLILAHELTSGHAYQFATGTAPRDEKGRQNMAIQSENEHRSEHKIPPRPLKS